MLTKNGKVRALSHRLTLGALLFSNLVFIFLNSLTPAAVSAGNSQGVFAALSKIFGFLPFFTHTFVRKAAHFAEYALLGFLSFLFPRVFLSDDRRGYLLAFAFGLLIPLFDELLQSLVPGRSPAVFDWLIDVFGFLFGLLLSFLFQLLKNRKRGTHKGI